MKNNIASTKTAKPENFAFIASMVSKLLSRTVFVKTMEEIVKSRLLLRK